MPLVRLIELKLASGMSAPHRLEDLADVLETIRATRSLRSLGDALDAPVREKHFELWQVAQFEEPE